jgi:hypothetical protein
MINIIKILTVTYNLNHDNTKLKFSKDFDNLPSICKLDILDDIIGDLINIYNNTLDKYND